MSQFFILFIPAVIRLLIYLVTIIFKFDKDFQEAQYAARSIELAFLTDGGVCFGMGWRKHFNYFNMKCKPWFVIMKLPKHIRNTQSSINYAKIMVFMKLV